MAFAGINEYHKAVLSYLIDNQYGKRSTSRIYDEFESEILDRDVIEQILEDLQDAAYIKPVEFDEQRVGFMSDISGEFHSKDGFKITQLGKGVVEGRNLTTVYSNIQNSNIAHYSPHASQGINITELPDDIQKSIAELQLAIEKKNAASIKKAFSYIADKALDVAIAIITGTMLSK